jgi:hypothetical protein
MSRTIDHTAYELLATIRRTPSAVLCVDFFSDFHPATMRIKKVS